MFVHILRVSCIEDGLLKHASLSDVKLVYCPRGVYTKAPTEKTNYGVKIRAALFRRRARERWVLIISGFVALCKL